MGRRGIDEPSRLKHRNPAELVVEVPRENWNARDPKEDLPPLQRPVYNIFLTWTDTEPCLLPDECSKAVRAIQKDHMKNKDLPDIQYNFLVGEDKFIYVGRGWDKAPPNYPDTIKNGAEYNDGKSIQIAFIHKQMEVPGVDYVNATSHFIAKHMIEGNVQKPIKILGIKDNEVVEFWRLFNKENYL